MLQPRQGDARGACCFRFSCSRSKRLSTSHCPSLELGSLSVPAPPQLYLGFAPGAEARPPSVPSGLLPAVPPPLQTVGTKASSHCLLVGSKRSRIFVSWLQKGILKTLRDPNNVTCIILMPEVMKTQTHDFLASLHVIGAAVPEDIYICPVGEVGIPRHGSAGSSRLRVQRGHLGGPKWPRGE